MPKIPPKSLRRRQPQVRLRRALLIFCEGQVSEPSYFREFANEHANMLVKLDLRYPGVPTTLVEQAVAFKKKHKRKNSFETNDQVWCVFDRDEHPNIERAFITARDNGVKIAYSNPCFELWFLLHIQDHDGPLDRHSMQKLCEKVVPGYTRTRSKCCSYEQIRSGYEQAELRAERLIARREADGSAKGNPYTDIHVLTKLIRDNGRK